MGGGGGGTLALILLVVIVVVVLKKRGATKGRQGHNDESESEREMDSLSASNGNYASVSLAGKNRKMIQYFFLGRRISGREPPGHTNFYLLYSS